MIGQHVLIKAPNGSVRLALVTSQSTAAGTVDLAVFGPSAMVFSPGVPVSTLQEVSPSVESVMEAAAVHRAKESEKALEEAAAQAVKPLPAPAVEEAPAPPAPVPDEVTPVPTESAAVEAPKPSSRSRR